MVVLIEGLIASYFFYGISMVILQFGTPGFPDSN